MANQIDNLPWKDDAVNYVGCNFAYADLTNNLPRFMTVDGRIHAETLVSASGAIAGFAAQQALLAQKENFSIDLLNEHSTVDGLFIVRSPRGDRYIYGNPLKEMVFCANNPATPITARLWEWAAGGATEAGLDKSAMPNTLTMWEDINRCIQEGTESLPSVPKEHWPHLPPVQLLERLWPTAKKLLMGQGSGAAAPPGIVVVEHRWWPTITGILTSVMIQKVKEVLDPRMALVIAMESAIVTLKVDPTRFQKN
jgi:hypothetical protein